MSDHVSQLTEELKKKTKLIQSFLLREQHGRIKPPGKEQELHKKVNSIMDTIYAPNSAGKKWVLGVVHSLRANFFEPKDTKSYWLEKVPLVWSECSFRATRPGTEIHVFTKFYFFYFREYQHDEGCE